MGKTVGYNFPLRKEEFDTAIGFDVKDRYAEVTTPAAPKDLNNKLDLVDVFALVNDPKKLGEALCDTREKYKITQEEVAEASGIAQPTISKLELGKGNPTWRKISSYVDAVKVIRDSSMVPVNGSGPKVQI